MLSSLLFIHLTDSVLPQIHLHNHLLRFVVLLRSLPTTNKFPKVLPVRSKTLI